MQTTFDTRPPIGFPGMPGDMGPKYDRGYQNTALDVAGVTSVAIGTFAASTEYALSINNVKVSVVSPATGGTATTVRDSLIAAINLSYAGVDALATGAAITITGVPGTPLTVTAITPNLTPSVVTPVVTSGEIPCGLAVVRLSTDSDSEVRLGAPSNAHQFLGVALDPGWLTNRFPYANQQASAYRRGDTVMVREAGSIFVVTDGIVTPSSPVFYRYSGAGIIGAFLGASAAGADIQLKNARFLSSNSSGVAQILLGYSTVASGTTP